MKTEDLEQQFVSFADSLSPKAYEPKNWNKIRNWLHFFEGGIYNIKGKQFELAYVAFCAIVESIAVDKYKKQIKREDNFILKFLRCLAQSFNLNCFQKKYGITSRFVKIILEFYKERGTFPHFIRYKLKKNNGYTSLEDAKYANIEEAYKELEKTLKNIYRKFRSDPVHQAIRLNFETDLMCRMEDAHSIPDWLRVQNFGIIVLELMKSRVGELKK